MMTKFSMFMVFAITLAFSMTGYAEQDAENALLASINHEIDMILPLVNQAEAEAQPNTRELFHYDWLRDDLRAIQSGINQKLNNISQPANQIIPIKGDYSESPWISANEDKGSIHG